MENQQKKVEESAEYFEDYDDDDERTPAVFEIDGELYQQVNKRKLEDWESSGIWKRHTVSSKAKDWGILRAHQSEPLPSLYQRGKNYDAVPAFKQYDTEAMDAMIQRVQRPTKSALLRCGHASEQDINNNNDDENGEQKEKKEDEEEQKPPIEQAVLVERLMRPTASQSRRVELTLKYRQRCSTAKT